MHATIHRIRIAFSWLCIVGLVFAPTALLAAERPNIIFCMTDDQGYGDVGYQGHPVLMTPTLDEMAVTGLRLDRFYSASPVCSPTRASVLTGRSPNRTGVFRWGNALRPEERTLSALLADAGYRTGFFGKWHLGSIRAGRPTSPGARGFERWTAAANFFMNDPWMSRDGQPVQLVGEGSLATVDEALGFIREAAAGDQPFLAFVWFGSPHTPHQATEELKSLYADQSPKLRNYYGEITGVDQAMGKLRDELRELDIHRQTLLMFTSDNGGRTVDGADHRGLRGQKSDLWEGGIRVPALIEWPGRIVPRSTDMPAGTVDLFPTFLDLAGVPRPTDRPLDGISLVPLLDGAMTSRPQPLGFWDYSQPETIGMKSDEIVQQLRAVLDSGGVGEINEGILHPATQPWTELDVYPGRAAWMDNHWKLHRTADQRYLLFDLAQDPAEQADVFAEQASRGRRMSEELRAWEDSVIQSVRGADY